MVGVRLIQPSPVTRSASASNRVRRSRRTSDSPSGDGKEKEKREGVSTNRSLVANGNKCELGFINNRSSSGDKSVHRRI